MWLEEDRYVDDITVVAVRFFHGEADAAKPSAIPVTAAAASAPAAATAPQHELPPAQGRNSVTGLGKRGMVSGESSSSSARKGGAQPGKVKKANATVEVLIHAIRDPRHLIFHGMSGAAREQPGLTLLG